MERKLVAYGIYCKMHLFRHFLLYEPQTTCAKERRPCSKTIQRDFAKNNLDDYLNFKIQYSVENSIDLFKNTASHVFIGKCLSGHLLAILC